MRAVFLVLFVILANIGFGLEKLSNTYTVSYGNREAPVHVTQYFSFTCPHCVALFRKEFEEIKQKYLDTGKVYWVFHPVPMDILTVQGMVCLDHLSSTQKKIFLEAILEELVIDKPTVSAHLMQKGMELLDNPLPELLEKEYLSNEPAFFAAFEFLRQEEKIEAVPAVEVNGVFYPGKIPGIDFLKNILEGS